MRRRLTLPNVIAVGIVLTLIAMVASRFFTADVNLTVTREDVTIEQDEVLSCADARQAVVELCRENDLQCKISLCEEEEETK